MRAVCTHINTSTRAYMCIYTHLHKQAHERTDLHTMLWHAHARMHIHCKERHYHANQYTCAVFQKRIYMQVHTRTKKMQIYTHTLARHMRAHPQYRCAHKHARKYTHTHTHTCTDTFIHRTVTTSGIGGISMLLMSIFMGSSAP